MNNQEKNTYVKEQIKTALLSLLKTKQLHEISITEIVNTARVGRASFYRNYESKEDILKQYDLQLIKAWGAEFEANPTSSIHTVFGSLFQHYKDHSDFYLLLYHNQLTDTILHTILEVSGPKSEMDNKEAYGKAFIAYGIYGWVMEWMERGMVDEAEEINRMLG